MQNLDRFKFRVWYTDPDDCVWNDMYNVKSFCDQYVKINDGESVRKFDRKQCDIMQCTGLKDQNGKLIFEGDIIILTESSVPFKKASIYFEKGCFYADDKNPVGNVSLRYLVDNKRDVEIIGNIYENPELLQNV